VVPTGLAIALVGFALVMVNFAIDEITNPRLEVEARYSRVLKEANLRPGVSTPVIRGRGAREGAEVFSD
jgi:peptide/nickel transport system permease protein